MKLIIKNKAAWHHYNVLESYEAGLSLLGTEVKSLRQGRVKIKDAFCLITPNLQFQIKNMHISTYDFGNRNNHDPDRVRTLLMHRKEIIRLYTKVKKEGLTLIPLKVYFKKNWIKVEVGLCRGKKLYDKRQELKKNDANREIQKALKQKMN